MSPATSAQRTVIDTNARAFTGRGCKTYGIKLNPAPPNITAAQAKLAADLAVTSLVELYQKLEVPITRFVRTPAGGAHLYLAKDRSYMEVLTVKTGGRYYQGIRACVLR